MKENKMAVTFNFNEQKYDLDVFVKSQLIFKKIPMTDFVLDKNKAPIRHKEIIKPIVISLNGELVLMGIPEEFSEEKAKSYKDLYLVTKYSLKGCLYVDPAVLAEQAKLAENRASLIPNRYQDKRRVSKPSYSNRRY